MPQKAIVSASACSNPEFNVQTYPRIVAVGEFPPPVTGNSRITKSICDEFEKPANIVLNRVSVTVSDGGLILKAIKKTQKYLSAMHLLAHTAKHPNKKLYFVCAGQFGLLLSLMLLLLARLYRYDIYLHHHSFGAINNPNIIMRLINLFLGETGHHIFLSEGMANKYFKVYGKRRKYYIEHNLNHIGSFWKSARKIGRRKNSATIRVGLLSNLSNEKGLDTFLSVERRAESEGLPIEFHMAGPVSNPDEYAAIRERLGPRLKYHGSLYGTDKVRFYRNLDVFLFPTRYFHEAQPLVLHEALAAGCVVIAPDRGCIAEDLNEVAGYVVPADSACDPFAYLDILRTLSRERMNLISAQASSLRLTQKRIAVAISQSRAWRSCITAAK